MSNRSQSPMNNLSNPNDKRPFDKRAMSPNVLEGSRSISPS